MAESVGLKKQGHRRKPKNSEQVEDVRFVEVGVDEVVPENEIRIDFGYEIKLQVGLSGVSIAAELIEQVRTLRGGEDAR